jgi:hypothetical protein
LDGWPFEITPCQNVVHTIVTTDHSLSLTLPSFQTNRNSLQPISLPYTRIPPNTAFPALISEGRTIWENVGIFTTLRGTMKRRQIRSIYGLSWWLQAFFQERGIQSTVAHGEILIYIVSSSPQTYIGQVLVSVNPYKNLNIYTQEDIKQYQNTHFFQAPPHV